MRNQIRLFSLTVLLYFFLFDGALSTSSGWADESPTPQPVPSPSSAPTVVLGDGNWVSWFNEGTRLLQEKKVDSAWAYFDAALAAKPWDFRIRNNRKICDMIETPRPGDMPIDRDPSANWVETVDSWVPLTVLELIAAVVGLIWAASSFRRLKRGAFGRVAKPYVLAILVIILVEGLRIYPGLRPLAWAPQNLSLRSGPGGDFPVLAEVKAGTRLRREGSSVSSSGLWVQLGFAPGRVGWVAADGVLQLPDGTEKTRKP